MENNLFQRLFGRSAPGPARRDDADLQAPGLVDTPAGRDPIRGGLDEDAVAMPGGGSMSIDAMEEDEFASPDLLRKANPDVWRSQELGDVPVYDDDMPLEDQVSLPGGGTANIDDLEGAGTLTPDLLRKAWPSVWQHQEAELPGFQARVNGHQGPALDRYSTFAGNTAHIDGAAPLTEELYSNARDEAALKGVPLGRSRANEWSPFNAITRPRRGDTASEYDPLESTQRARDLEAAEFNQPVDLAAVREASPEALAARELMFPGAAPYVPHSRPSIDDQEETYRRTGR